MEKKKISLFFKGIFFKKIKRGNLFTYTLNIPKTFIRYHLPSIEREEVNILLTLYHTKKYVQTILDKYKLIKSTW